METNYDAAAEEASMRWQNPVMNPSGPVINPGSTSVVELLKRADAQAPGTGRGIPAGVGASMPRRKGEPPRGLPASYFSGAHPNAQGNTKSKATGAVDEGVATFLLEQERALHERRTPAMLACTMGNNAVLEVLQQYGANVSEAIETPSGWSTHIYGARTNALEDIHLGRLTSSA
ncbi:unnamed protein product [Amoebophrya sp. A25]|nr:unnamed protein product [Amoebophrya sp. A25]|eukprot:GSA25T00014784001.1